MKRLPDSRTSGPRLRLMGFPVTVPAQRDEIVLHVIAQLAPELHVMNFQSNDGPTALAAPLVALQHRLTQPAIGFWVKTQSWAFRFRQDHVALCRPSRNCSRCGEGRSLKRRSMERSNALGSPFSRVAPARKSAQIISRQ